jgi:pimeloyl-ACP methyl ester carboxylesterase
MTMYRVIAVMLVLCVSATAQNEAARKVYLETLQDMTPAQKEFSNWLKKSEELPPDFENMPSIPNLPDPLLIDENTLDEWSITTPEEWYAHRETLKTLFQKYITGTVPPRPDNLVVKVLSEVTQAHATVREVELRFGPGHEAKLDLTLYIPRGEGPFPVFISQDNHRAWGLIALRRGYIACIYAGSDSRDDTATFIEPYPEYDWSKLMRRGWAASRCIDYLETVPQAHLDQIALTGHSRNGKTSLMASAMDERISAVISSSSGAGGCNPTRTFSEQHMGEGPEFITRNFPDWFHPRFRFFTGREDKLPIDLHQLVALSAPRPCLIRTAVNDGVEDAWAVQDMYLSVQRVYELLGAKDKLRIRWDPAGHETWPTVIEGYLDWCDGQFGRSDFQVEERFLYPYDWNAVPSQHEPIALPKDAPLRDRVTALLGTQPGGARHYVGTYGVDKTAIEHMVSRHGNPPGTKKQDLMFGEYINADVFTPRNRDDDEELPVILWLHPWCTAKGYVGSYRRGDPFPYHAARAGFATFCFDHTGTGRRVEELENFYTRHPDWSILGKMVWDAQCALDAIETLEGIDRDRIFVVGYGLGAMVASHLAALDDRPAGYVLVAPPQPFAADDPEVTGGIRRWSKDRMWIPRLGAYIGNEANVPYDLPDLIEAMAPWPVLILAQEWDRETVEADLDEAVKTAQHAFPKDQLDFTILPTYNHFVPDVQEPVLEWLKETSSE